jgi:DNA repair protein RecO (recombination protein O)
MSEREEVLLEFGFVLHHRPFRNTSLIVECLTETHGRTAFVASGSRRSGTGHRALLQPFQPLKLSWVRRGELGRLTQVEALQRGLELKGDHLLAGFYCNELMLRLLPRGDRNDAVFSCYSSCLAALAGSDSVSRSLRLFELSLLDALGYRVELEHDVTTGAPLEAEREYGFELEGGPVILERQPAAERYSGKHLISLRNRSLDDPESLRVAKRLLSRILRSYLGERPLKSREVLKELVDGGFER